MLTPYSEIALARFIEEHEDTTEQKVELNGDDVRWLVDVLTHLMACPADETMVSLRRLPRAIGVPSMSHSWLESMVRAGQLPYLQAGQNRLFHPTVCREKLMELASAGFNLSNVEKPAEKVAGEE